MIENPLLDFPHDVPYLSAAEIENRKKRHAMLMLRKDKETLPPEVLAASWGERRCSAIAGKDPVAKRAAQNDTLWLWYCGIEDAGVKVTMPLLKQRVNLDVQRSKLYPQQSYVAEINRSILDRVTHVPRPRPGEKATSKVARVLLPKGKKIPSVSVDYTSIKPPDWYLREVAQDGRLTDLRKFFQDFGKQE